MEREIPYIYFQEKTIYPINFILRKYGFNFFFLRVIVLYNIMIQKLYKHAELYREKMNYLENLS